MQSIEFAFNSEAKETLWKTIQSLFGEFNILELPFSSKDEILKLTKSELDLAAGYYPKI